jgi:hypothetical protein
MDKTSYSLQCSGVIGTARLAQLCEVFKSQGINIRKLILLPAFEEPQQERIEIQFELIKTQQRFLTALKESLDSFALKDPLILVL